jgi:hypothetical protein
MTEDIKNMIREHVDMQIALMEPGEVTDCKGLFIKDIWELFTPLERRYILGRTISMYVAHGELDLEFAGFNGERHNLYRRIVH